MLSAVKKQFDGRFAGGELTVNQAIFYAAATVSVATLAVKLVATVKELLVARFFGTGSSLDAFLIAFVVPAFGINVLAASLRTAFIPVFISEREQSGPEAARRLLRTVSLAAPVLLLVIIGIQFLLAPAATKLLGSGFSPDTLRLTRRLYVLLLPVLALSGLAQIWSGVLHAHNKFALVAFAPILTPLCTLLCLATLGTRWGVTALVAGILGGAVAEMLLLGTAVARLGFSLAPGWDGWTQPLRRISRQYAPLVAGACLMSSTVAVDQGMAAMLAPGSVATLNYALKVPALLLGIGGALGTVALPHFARMAARNDYAEVRRTFRTYARLIAVLTLPVTVLLVVASGVVIKLLFQRGEFTAGDTSAVSRVQAFYLLQLAPFLLGMLAVRLISALEANRYLMWGSAANLVANVTFNIVFVHWLGISGIALSTSTVYLMSCIYLWVMLFRELKRRERGAAGGPWPAGRGGRENHG